MKVRQAVFDTYWRFAKKRQDVFFARIRNLPPPWSDDEILNTYKFCNAYRASDRVSQYLIRSVIYDRPRPEEDEVFRILLFKFFNKIETWTLLRECLGDDVTLASFDFDRYVKILSAALAEGRKIYTSAYMSCATKAYGYDKKHENHLALLRQMLSRDKLVAKLTRTKSFREVFLLLVEYPLIGNFMAYQLATDINYGNVVNFDENSFTMPGPGAERGIAKCFHDTGGLGMPDVIKWMVDEQEREFDRLGLDFQNLWGRPLQAIDCQNLFCETDKYSRQAFPDLKSNRVRIKKKFSPLASKIPYFYPPKWGINDAAASELANHHAESVASATVDAVCQETPQLPLF